MRKESGFNPHDVSYADARGLLQMIPPTSARVAATAGEPFYPDLLYDPEVNIRLGARFIGSPLQQVRARDPADRRRVQRGSARDDTLVRPARQPPHRRVRRADRVRADARVRQARDQYLRQVPLPVRPDPLRDPADARHEGRRRAATARSVLLLPPWPSTAAPYAGTTSRGVTGSSRPTTARPTCWRARPSAIEQDGATVEVDGKVDDEAMGLAMTGPILKVKTRKAV